MTMENIKWQRKGDSWRTRKFGGFLIDELQGVVTYFVEPDEYSGGVINWDDRNRSAFRYDFKSKRAAVAWVNGELKKRLDGQVS